MARIQRTHHPIFQGHLDTSTFSPIENGAGPQTAPAGPAPAPQASPCEEAVAQVLDSTSVLAVFCFFAVSGSKRIIQTQSIKSSLSIMEQFMRWTCGTMQANNPVRSRAHDNATGTIASGLDMWHDAHGTSNGARFASHSAWEVQHDQSISQEQARQASALMNMPLCICPSASAPKRLPLCICPEDIP